MNILVITDSQVKDGVPLDYLTWIGRCIMDLRPDVIVHIGDFADMPSLSLYDKFKKSYEGRRYKADIAAARRGMGMILTLGNHEERILRAIESDPILDGTIGIEDLKYEESGWEVYPFLEVVTVNGVAFSHYFATGAKGMPASSAQALINKKHMSCVAGHQQGRQIAYATRADGKRLTAIICGSCYCHDEKYLGPQSNKHWHGLVHMERVNDGEFDERFIPLPELREKYAHQ